MFSSPVLDLVILLSFTYFVGSVILSAINEAISGILSKRSSALEKSICDLFFNDQTWLTFVNTTFVQSPHIQSLMKKADKFPSYIPSKNFAQAIISQLVPNGFTSANLVAAINAAPFGQKMKDTLLTFEAQAAGNLQQFEHNIEDFFDNAMDRVTGVYKRHMRLMLLFLGFILALCMNLDTIMIVRSSLTDKTKLGQTVDNIVTQMANVKVSHDSTNKVSIVTSKDTITVSATAGKSGSSVSDNIKAAKQVGDYLQQNAGVNLGYRDWKEFSDKWTISKKNVGNFFLALVGILITTFALQLSSGFWFDLMNKVVNIRAAGQRPKTAKQER